MPTHNRLIDEKSPYLLQHAANPVDWHPWDERAFDTAKKAHKPIFLSIGYSTCHWCHVMAHESFEDADIARLMNDAFINIKVDREERPDIDKIYMTVCQMLTGSGGWPLTIIMTPDKKPFYAATYIPRETRFGRVGMRELIPHIGEIWKNRYSEVANSADTIVSSLKTLAEEYKAGEPDETVLHSAYEQLEGMFDEKHGGFGTAPKFPAPQNLLFLLRYWKRSGNATALRMVQETLDAMRVGGIYDHIGYGFHRYSVDQRWFLPHFEKMLYDQAMLTLAYIEAYQATGTPDYARTAREIMEYVLRDMTAPHGGFYSAEDADSEGAEGKFYVWSQDEIEQALDKEEAALAVDIYNITASGNFSDEETGQRTGHNILYRDRQASHTARASIRAKLYAAREKRVHPHKDKKILTDWNGMMIAALARAAQVFDDASYAEAAGRAVDFILHSLQREDGRLLHRFCDNHAGIPAHLDDYAFFIWGLIELYEATFDTRYLRTALVLSTDMTDHFWDESKGGFFFTADDGDTLIIRQKEVFEGAIPSGNSIAMWSLLRLGLMTSNTNYTERASRIGGTFYGSIAQSPAQYTQMLSALDFAFGPSFEIVIVGDPDARETRSMLTALRSRFIPNKVVMFRSSREESPEIHEIAPFLRELAVPEGGASAYICDYDSCRIQGADVEQVLRFLDEAGT
jgi:uncharacterized protein YyaL (SSP411 family)